MPRPRLRDCFKSGAVKGGDGKMGKFYDKRKVRQAKAADDAASGRHADTVEVPQEKEAGEAGQGGGMAAARNVRQMPSGLQMVDVRIGKGPPPEPGQNVFCKYQGVLAATMKKFDEGKLTFHVGRGEVIAGLDEAVAGMRQGGVAKLRIPPHLGYGTSGAPPKVPPHATLLFDVAVVRIGSRKQNAAQKEEEEWVAMGGKPAAETAAVEEAVAPSGLTADGGGRSRKRVREKLAAENHKLKRPDPKARAAEAKKEQDIEKKARAAKMPKGKDGKPLPKSEFFKSKKSPRDCR